MDIIDYLCKAHKICSIISLRMNYKQCADSSEWSEHGKQKNVIHFECKSRDVSRALIYFKHTYPSKITAVQAEIS